MPFARAKLGQGWYDLEAACSQEGTVDTLRLYWKHNWVYNEEMPKKRYKADTWHEECNVYFEI